MIKIKFNIAFILFLFVSNISNSQTHTFDWVTATHSNGHGVTIQSVKTDIDNNVYTLGSYFGAVDIDPSATQQYLTPNGINGLYIVKQSSTGNTIWIRTIQGSFTGFENLAIDPTNNMYITGAYSGTVDFNPGVAINNLSTTASQEMFVLALDTSSTFKWVKSFTSTGTTTPYHISIDFGYNVLLCGSFTGTTDFNPSSGIANKTSQGGQDAFAMQLDFLGNLNWIKTFGGSGPDVAKAIQCNTIGNYYITGLFNGTVDLNPDLGVNNETVTNTSGFIIKLDAGSNFGWAKIITSVTSNVVIPWHIEAINSNDLVIVGSFDGTADFDPSISTNTITSSNSGMIQNMFVLNLDFNGNYIKAVSYIASTSTHQPFDVDVFGSIYITGKFSGTVDFDPGSGTEIKTTSNNDIYILKLKSDLSFDWVETLGGSDWDEGEDIVLDNNANVYASGYFGSTVDFDFSASTQTLSVNQFADLDSYLLKINQCIIPIITADSTLAMACENSNAVIFASALGVNTSYVWQVNTGTGFINISGSNYTDYVAGNDYYLEIYPTPINFDANQYRLIVTNSCGADTSRATILIVNTSPQIVTQPVNTSVCENSSTVFTLTGIAADPIYNWYANGNLIFDGTTYSGTTTNSLTILSASSVLNNTQYYCLFAGNCGLPVISNTVTLNVNQLPLVIAQTSDTLLCSGNSATLTASGASTYTWTGGNINNTILVTPTVNTTYTVIGQDINGCVDTSIIMQNVSICTNIKNIKSIIDENFSIYPNPASNFLIIQNTQLTPFNITLINSLGEIVYESNNNENRVDFEVSHFTKGLYVLKISQKNNALVSKKIIIQ